MFWDQTWNLSFRFGWKLLGPKLISRMWIVSTCFSVASHITDLILHPCITQSISWYIPSYMVVGGNLRHNKVASGRERAGAGVGGYHLPRSRHGMDTSSHNAAAARSPGSDTITWLPLLWAATLPAPPMREEHSQQLPRIIQATSRYMDAASTLLYPVSLLSGWWETDEEDKIQILIQRDHPVGNWLILTKGDTPSQVASKGKGKGKWKGCEIFEGSG